MPSPDLGERGIGRAEVPFQLGRLVRRDRWDRKFWRHHKRHRHAHRSRNRHGYGHGYGFPRHGSGYRMGPAFALRLDGARFMFQFD